MKTHSPTQLGMAGLAARSKTVAALYERRTKRRFGLEVGGRRPPQQPHREFLNGLLGQMGANMVRLRISPDVQLAFGFNVSSPVEESQSYLSELLASRQPSAREMDAYERVLGDAMAGDATLFACEDYVEEARRIVDPVLKSGTPIHEYEPNSWGPPEAERVTPPGGWRNPVLNGREST